MKKKKKKKINSIYLQTVASRFSSNPDFILKSKILKIKKILKSLQESKLID